MQISHDCLLTRRRLIHVGLLTLHLHLLIHGELVHSIVHSLLTFHIFIDHILLTVEIKLLDWANLLVKSLDLEFVGIYLRLVVFKLLNHFFQLLSSLFQVLLVNLKLFSNFWTTLLGQDVFELNVKLLFLLNEHIFLRNFFSFGNKPLLKWLNLLDHLISFWVGTLKLSPSMNIEWLSKLVK